MTRSVPFQGGSQYRGPVSYISFFSLVYSAQGCWSAGCPAVTGDVLQIRVDEVSAYTKPHTNEMDTNNQLLGKRCKQINVKERILVTKLI
jgi:hypothetical protein